MNTRDRVERQAIPVKVYRTAERVIVAAPMPGLEPQDISVEVTANCRLILRGEMRGLLKQDKEVLRDEWNPGPYFREIDLPVAVDGEWANVTYGNGILVVALPVVQWHRPTRLALERLGSTLGERVGHTGSPPSQMTTREHRGAIYIQHAGAKTWPRH